MTAHGSKLSNIDYDAQGTLAGRPGFGSQGRLYFATDCERLFFDTGAAWVDLTGERVGQITYYAGASAPSANHLLCDYSERAIADYPVLYAVVGTTYGNLTNGSGGAGSTHFRLPDARGRVFLHPDGAAARIPANDLLGQSDGAATHIIQAAELPPHVHTGPSHTHDLANHTHTVNNHAHGIGDDGYHGHGLAGYGTNSYDGGGGNRPGVIWGPGNADYTAHIAPGGNHNHGGATGGAAPGTTGPSTNATGSGGTGNTGNGPGASTPHNNLQPYLVCTAIIRCR